MRLFVVPALLLSTLLSAQQVVLRGKVEDVSGKSQFVIDCSDTQLTSSTVKLGAFLGQEVQIKGTRLAGPGAPLVDVVSIAPAKERATSARRSNFTARQRSPRHG